MLVDRIFGALAAAGFALGIALQLSLLIRDAELQFHPMFAATALWMIVFAYMLLHVGVRDNLPYDGGEMNFMPLVWALPPWAMIVSFLLFGCTVATWILSFIPDWLVASLVPNGWTDAEVIEHRFHAHRIEVAAISMFTSISYVFAAYLLLRNHPPQITPSPDTSA